MNVLLAILFPALAVPIEGEPFHSLLNLAAHGTRKTPCFKRLDSNKTRVEMAHQTFVVRTLPD